MNRLPLLACVGVLVLGGCMSSGSNFDEERVTQITKGQTTRSDLVRMFGEPTGQSADSSGATSMQWMYMEHRTDGRSFIPVAGAWMGGGKSRNKMLNVTLSPDGTVQSFDSSASGMDTRHHTQSKTANTNESP